MVMSVIKTNPTQAKVPELEVEGKADQNGNDTTSSDIARIKSLIVEELGKRGYKIQDISIYGDNIA